MGRICINYSIYIHIPFCTSRCAYCDFNTYADRLHLLDDYVRALGREMRLVAEKADVRLPVHTVFFGGGTPSLLEIEHVDALLAAVRDLFDLQEDTEITIEANPGSLDARKLTGWRNSGVNRLSLGVQAAQESILSRLNRKHTARDVVDVVASAKAAGFTNIGFDLIYGIPLQTLQEWRESLDFALQQNIQHLSLYALTLEEHTPLERDVASGRLPHPDDDLAADMYETADDLLLENGFAAYEISNFRRLDLSKNDPYRCRHNLQYWRNLPYLGFGAGAHGYAGTIRSANVPGIEAYIQRVNAARIDESKQHVHAAHTTPFPASPAALQVTRLERRDEIGETMMMGLRLTEEGVGEESFTQRFSASLESLFSVQIAHLIAVGLLTWEAHHHEGRILRLTKRGRLLGNQAFMAFV